jgi:hypothetical protein
MKKIAFLSESNFKGKITRAHPNMRVDLSWYCALNADHYPITDYPLVSGYDYVVVILPKGDCTVNIEGSPITLHRKKELLSYILKTDIADVLKRNNGKLAYMQEGPSGYWNDYELVDQLNHINFLSDCDLLLGHNKYDLSWYKGLFNDKRVEVLPSLLIEDSIKNINNPKEDKVIIGGNMSSWYGGMQSYLLALDFDHDIWVPSMHCRRQGEEQLDRLHHFSYMPWIGWMNELSKFKYAIHLMKTVAAGTFSLNCAYFSIPCIGNENVDTQRVCHPQLSVDVNDLNKARKLVNRLKTDVDFYKECADDARLGYRNFTEEKFLSKVENIFV